MGPESENESMLQLAAEAFRAKDFDLAADIYECQLRGAGAPPPGNTKSCRRRLELMVKLADALAFGGRLTEALGVYRQASEMERLQGPEHLEKLLEYLTESVRRKEVGRCRRRSSGSSRGGAEADTEVPPAAGHHQRLGRPAAAGAASLSDPRKDYGGGGGSSADSCADFSCRICLSFLYEPVTLTCGHCFCKKCLEREKPGAAGCRECGSGSTALTDVAGGHGGYRVNVVLSNLLSKWFPLHSHAVRLRQEGNGLYADGKMEAALEKYNQAILIAPTDHILFSNRSQIHSSLRHYDQALRDAETTCTLMPQWSKGHVRKAQALMSLGRSEEALREYLISLSIEPSRLARSEAYKLLSDLLAPLTDHVPERVLDYSSSLSSRMHIKNNMAAHTASSLYTTASLKSSQSLSTSKSSSESNLLASPPVLKHPQCPCERSAGEEVRDQSEAQGGWLEQGFLPIRKRKSVEEEDGGEKRDGCKRSKLESADVCGSLSSVVADLIDPTDLECSLCMRLFYEPVTTPCGHTFCLQCLERCLDHNPKCPLCKQELSEYLAQRQYFKTVLMENLIAKYVPSEMMDRQKVNREELAELSNLNKNVPIFVCTMAFPTVPCPLHIFEPCYRLMIRRCMETGTKCFGMCLGDDLKGKISPRFASYGCLLEIRDVEFFSDGRSVVDTIGRRRFKVLQHHQRDGYNTADIEYLEDIKVEGVAEKELQSLHDAVYDQALIWVNSLKKEQKERIVGHFGPMPEKDPEPQTSPNGPSWCWWLLAVLPLEGRAQLPFLAITSLKERLCGIRRVLLFMTCSKHR